MENYDNDDDKFDDDDEILLHLMDRRVRSWGEFGGWGSFFERNYFLSKIYF